jgi:hypothetical protein
LNSKLWTRNFETLHKKITFAAWHKLHPII